MWFFSGQPFPDFPLASPFVSRWFPRSLPSDPVGSFCGAFLVVEAAGAGAGGAARARGASGFGAAGWLRGSRWLRVGDADSFKGNLSLQSMPNHQDTRLNEIHLSATQCPSLSCECQTHQEHPTRTNKPKTKTRDAGAELQPTFKSYRVALLPPPPANKAKEQVSHVLKTDSGR